MALDQSDFRALLHRYQQGDCTPAEKRRVEQWYKDLGAKQQFLLSPAEKAALMETVWQRIADQTTTAFPRPAAARQPKTVPRRQAWPVAGARWAAVALLALGVGAAGAFFGPGPKWAAIWHPQEQAAADWLVYSNDSAQEALVALPDGSAITLFPASTLRYPRTFAGVRRTVYLTGAAFFDVFHDPNHPFLVYTDQVVTTVLGTSFRVQAYAGQPEVQVQVMRGKVRVSPRTEGTAGAAPSLVVLPNQQAVYSPGRRQLRRELVAKPVLLAPQPFVFNDRPVAEVLAALTKAYGVDIVYDAAALRACTINISLGKEPLFEKLDIICETLGASYTKADGRIFFRSQPCATE